MVDENEIQKEIIKEKLELAPIKVKSEQKEPDLIDVLKKFSPGTSIRAALDDILRARMGALIVIDREGLSNIVEGGFRINAKFSQQRLVELAKTDGAIVLSEDIKKIFSFNTVLFPDIRLSTKETGTRHQAAERTAKQLRTIAVAVSERKNKITIFYGDKSYELEKSSEVLRRAAETLQILEKQKEIFNDLMVKINVLEINNLVSISDVCEVLQRIEILKRVSEMVKRYLIELGKEGIIVSMRLRELTKDLGKERDLILKDYFKSKSLKIDSALSDLNFDVLLETSNLSKILFGESAEESIFPEGMRLLGKTDLSEKDIKLLIKGFKTLDNILNLGGESLGKLFKKKELSDFVNKELKDLREKIMSGRKI